MDESPRVKSEPGPVLTFLLSWWQWFWAYFFHGWPIALLLTMLTLVVHDWSGFRFVDAPFMRWVAQVRPPADDDDRLTPPMVQLLEVTAEARVRELERNTRSIPDSAVARLGGVRPIDRGQVAELLLRLAQQLGPLPPSTSGGTQRVVAIDVDIAPLEDGATTKKQRLQIVTALNELRKRAHVIVIVLSRNPSARLDRNLFIVKEAGCTRFDDTSSSRFGLYFASPRLFHTAGEYPLRFATSRREVAHENDLTLTPWYPGLGTLMHLRSKATDAGLTVDERRTLTALCEQANRNEVLEDALDAPESQTRELPRLLSSYKLEFFNWRLLDDSSIRHTSIASLKAIGSVKGAKPSTKTALDRTHLSAPVILVGIDGGAKNDKFEIPSNADPVSGAKMHALQAASLVRPLHETTWCGALADFAAGTVFVLLWSFFAPLLRCLRHQMPSIGTLVSVLVPLAIAGVIFWQSRYCAAALMNKDIWFNPFFVMLGLTLHAYLEGWAHRYSPRPSAHWWHGFLYGAGGARTAIGKRYDSSKLGVLPEMNGARFADVLLASTLCWVVVLWGLVILSLSGRERLQECVYTLGECFL